VAALVAIHSFTANLLQSVREKAQALLGADLCVASGARFTTGAEQAIADLAREAGRAGVPARLARVTSFGAMVYAPRTRGTRLVQISAVEPGYPFYGPIETAPAEAWAALPGGGLVADPALLTALDLEVGDTLVLGEARFTLAGTIRSVPGDIGVRAALGPRAFIAASRVEETRLLAFGSRARYEAFFALPKEADPQRLAVQFRPRLSAERATVRTVEDDQARLTESLGRLSRYLGLVALMALLLGGLGVASAVHAFVKMKLETVAVLRCLGATGGQVLGVYVAQAALLGLVGSALGAAVGVAVQLLFPRLLRGLLPVDVTIAVSWPAVLGGLGLGLWATLAFALLPLLRVRRVSPLVVLRRQTGEDRPAGREWARVLAAAALVLSVIGLAVVEAGRIGTGLAFSAGIGVALLALWLAAAALLRGVRQLRARRLPYLVRQGLANLHRPANQTVTVVLALGFGAFLLGTLVLLQHNLLRDLRTGGDAERPNLAFFDIQPDQAEAVAAAIRSAGFTPAAPVAIVPMRIRAVKGQLAADILRAPGDAREVADRWALRREYRSSYRDTLTRSERIVAGEAFAPGAGATTPVPVSLEAGLARELKVGVGDEIVWDVQGVGVPSRVVSLRDVEWARFEPNFFAVFPEGPLDAAPQTAVILTRVADEAARGTLQRRIAETLPNVTTLDLSQLQQAIETIVGRVALAIRFMASFTLAAGAVVLLGAVMAGRYQRVREGVLLRTLGATRDQVRRILLVEYAALGALASAAAALLAGGAGYALVRFVFEGRFVFPAGPFALLGASVVGLTLLVGLWGSTEAYRRTPIEVLRGE
jgi:putative ABC transport system permease protein